MENNVLKSVQKLVPEITARTNEIDAARSLPPDLIEKLRSAGIFRMMVSTERGGENLSAVEVGRVLEALARADASTAWTGLIGSGGNIMLGYYPSATIAELYREGPDVPIRGAIAPKGFVIPTDGGYMAKGSWSLASGSFDCKWMIGNCIVLQDGKPKMGPQGRPEMRLILVPRDKVRFRDTWDSLGLRGTASHDYEIDEMFVPEAYTANLFGTATEDTPFQKLPLFMKMAPMHASVCIGIAKGAMDDLIKLSKSKRPALGGGKFLSEDPLFNFRLGAASAKLESISFALDGLLQRNWGVAQTGKPATKLDEVQTSSLSAYIQVEAGEVVGELFNLTGATACYNSSSISRRLRDMRCATQHIAASQSAHLDFGRELVA